MSTVRVVHYVNQFFAGVGAEEKADVGPEARPGAVGAAAGLQKALGDQGKVVATVFCGDNYITENAASAAAEIVKLIRQFEPDVVVAGPAFGSGRYGLACGQVCTAVQDELHVPAIAGMYEESPGAELFRKTVTIVPTRETAAGMSAALKELARLALKLGSGERLGAPSDDGYIPRGVRRNVFAAERGAARAVTMLLKKLNGQAFTTEWPLPRYERVTPPAAMRTTKGILIALVAEGGVVPTGNPDRIPSGWATKWAKYDLTNVDDLTSESFETVHGGFDTTAANQDPDRLVPVDVVRQMEKEGELTLYPTLYSTVGNMGSITEMRRLGVEIAKELKEAGVDGVIVGAT